MSQSTQSGASTIVGHLRQFATAYNKWGASREICRSIDGRFRVDLPPRGKELPLRKHLLREWYTWAVRTRGTSPDDLELGACLKDTLQILGRIYLYHLGEVAAPPRDAAKRLRENADYLASAPHGELEDGTAYMPDVNPGPDMYVGEPDSSYAPGDDKQTQVFTPDEDWVTCVWIVRQIGKSAGRSDSLTRKMKAFGYPVEIRGGKAYVRRSDAIKMFPRFKHRLLPKDDEDA